jgi:predicted DNA-binding transcriptional regulator YafY
VPVLDTSSRLLELLGLLESRRDWTGPELAARLGVGARTIRRDVDRLRRLGYPVEAAPGVAGGYRLSAGAALPPLLLDAEEAVAIAVGLRASASAGIAGIEETSVRALAKLERLLPPVARRRVGALAAATVPYPGTGPAVDAGVLAAIAASARDRERLRFGYTTREGERRRRLVEPLRLVYTGRRWYLVAWDCGREAWRTFRVDRIAPPLAADRRFTPRRPPAADLAAWVASSISAVRDRYQAEVLLRAPASELERRVPRWLGTLEPAGEQTCILRATTDWLDGLAVHVAQIGVDFEVLGPPELGQRVAELAARFRRAARSPGRRRASEPS